MASLLLRADANLEAQCFLLSATPDFVQESSAGVPAKGLQVLFDEGQAGYLAGIVAGTITKSLSESGSSHAPTGVVISCRRAR